MKLSFLYIVKMLMPKKVRQRLKHFLRIRKKRALSGLNLLITQKDFVCTLKNIGLKSDDTVFIHSGADWLNKFEGGLLAVLQCIRQVLGSRGHILMPAFTIESFMLDAIHEQSFDVSTSVSKMGMLTEIFRRLPGVERSVHPTHSVCVQGPDAQYFVATHHQSTKPFGECSPFYKHVKKQGKILLLGVDIDVLTHIHVAEDICDKFPQQVYLPKPFNVSVKLASGKLIQMKTLVHNPKMSMRKNISKLKKPLLEKGIMINAKINDFTISLIDAQGLIDYLLTIAKAGKSVYAK